VKGELYEDGPPCPVKPPKAILLCLSLSQLLQVPGQITDQTNSGKRDLKHQGKERFLKEALGGGKGKLHLQGGEASPFRRINVLNRGHLGHLPLAGQLSAHYSIIP